MLLLENEQFQLAEGSVTTDKWRNGKLISIRGVRYILYEDGYLGDYVEEVKHYRAHGDFTSEYINHTENDLGYGQISLSGQKYDELFGEEQ
jgi:hypothetical protein